MGRAAHERLVGRAALEDAGLLRLEARRWPELRLLDGWTPARRAALSEFLARHAAELDALFSDER